MKNEICYLIISKNNMGETRIHGIYTDETIKEQKIDVFELKGKLKNKCDIPRIYMMPFNHLNEKGMIL